MAIRIRAYKGSRNSLRIRNYDVSRVSKITSSTMVVEFVERFGADGLKTYVRIAADITDLEQLACAILNAIDGEEHEQTRTLPHPPMQDNVCKERGECRPCSDHGGKHCIFCNKELK